MHFVSFLFIGIGLLTTPSHASFYECIVPICKCILQPKSLDPFPAALKGEGVVPSNLKTFSEQLFSALPSTQRLSTNEAEAIFNQNRALYSGSFDFFADDLSSSFLRKFWSPRTQIFGALEQQDQLVVFTHQTQSDFVSSALPRTYGGKTITYVETPFRSSASDPQWAKKYAKSFYLEPPVVLVTGASTGIGLALVKQLSDQGYRVVATARASSMKRFAELGLVENEKFLIRPLDVTRSEDIEVLRSELLEKFGGVDILVNNAGFVYRGTLEETSKAEMVEMMDANFFGPAELTKRLVPTMRMKGRGNVVFISSIAAAVSGPTKGAYSATKAATEGLAEGAWMELEPYGVHVTTIQPGFVHSDGASKVRTTIEADRALKNPNSSNHDLYEKVEKSVQYGIARSSTTPESVSDAVLTTIQSPRPKRTVLVGTDTKFFKTLNFLGPRARFLFFMRSLMGLNP